MKKLGLGGAAAGGVPRAADGEGAGRNLVRPKLATRCLQGWLEKMPATLWATWLAGRAAGTGQQRGRVEKGLWHWALVLPALQLQRSESDISGPSM